jgi:hypothetical protein
MRIWLFLSLLYSSFCSAQSNRVDTTYVNRFHIQMSITGALGYSSYPKYIIGFYQLPLKVDYWLVSKWSIGLSLIHDDRFSTDTTNPSPYQSVNWSFGLHASWYFWKRLYLNNGVYRGGAIMLPKNDTSSLTAGPRAFAKTSLGIRKVYKNNLSFNFSYGYNYKITTCACLNYGAAEFGIGLMFGGQK